MRKKEIRYKLAASLASAKMENAHFGLYNGPPVVLNTDAEANAYIKDRVRLYMQSWVIPGIEAAIAELDR